MVTPTSSSPSLRLLHLEDDAIDATLTHTLIRREWPGCEITRVDTREHYLTAITGQRFDLILSDFTMPAFNGLTALDFARRHDDSVPFIFLSGTIGEENAVLALQRGAIDYVMKDRPARLIPAMRRALDLRREQQLRQAAEQRIREQASLLDKARDAICLTDLDGRMLYRNQSAARLLGWATTTAQDRPLHELFKRSDPARLGEALQQLHATGTWHGQLRVAGADHHLRHIESRWTLVHDDTGRPRSILLINTDITEQKKFEEQLLHAQRLEGIGTLAGGIAHDLNNALAPVQMSLDLLRLGLHDEEKLRIVDVLDTSVQHGAALIRQLLSFARGAEGERVDLRLAPVIRDAITMLGDTLPRSISIESDLVRDLWVVHANSTQIIQVLVNLGINARDAMPKGGRLVFRAENIDVDEATARAHPGARSGPHVRITVADTGTGIPPDLLGRIFDPFFTTKPAGKGMGLGLAAVVGIMKGHGGFLQVHSEVDRGTEFRLHLPAAPTAEVASVPPPSTVATRGHGELMLVIDDNSNVREMARLLLVGHGYKVCDAANGLDGLILYRKHRDEAKVVITDMMMPGLQGDEIIRELRHINPDVRIVAMSGIARLLTALPRDPGRLAILTKPMSAGDLIAAIQSVLPHPAPAP